MDAIEGGIERRDGQAIAGDGYPNMRLAIDKQLDRVGLHRELGRLDWIERRIVDAEVTAIHGDVGLAARNDHRRTVQHVSQHDLRTNADLEAVRNGMKLQFCVQKSTP